MHAPSARTRSPIRALIAALLCMPLANAAAAGTNEFQVANSGASSYTIDAQSNPNLTLTRGQSYSFFINAMFHPFWIKSIRGNTSANAYNDGVTGNGTDVGTLVFNVPANAPDTLFYNCEFHGAMTGTINIIGQVTPVILFADGFE